MSKYEIITVHDWDNIWYAIFNTEDSKYFAGYNFMGGAEWQDCISAECYISEEDEAAQIIKDLEAADDPEEPEEDPAKKQYVTKITFEGETWIGIKTGKQIADRYEDDDIAGIYETIEVWDMSGDTPVKVKLLSLVEPILEQKRWMEQEYRDYCDSERY